MCSAFLRMLGVSLATFGSDRSSANSRRMAGSFSATNARADAAAFPDAAGAADAGDAGDGGDVAEAGDAPDAGDAAFDERATARNRMVTRRANPLRLTRAPVPLCEGLALEGQERGVAPSIPGQESLRGQLSQRLLA
jgi:hypothetical protein